MTQTPPSDTAAVPSPLDGSGAIVRQALPDQVAARLRRDILTGVLAPGQRLVVGELTGRLGVSHIPIREALRSLEAESLVTSAPGRGVVVTSVDLDDLHDLWHLRRLLEGDLVRRAFPSYTPEHLARFRERLDALLALRPQRNEDWWDAHRAFHRAFLEPALTPWTARMLHLVWQSAERYQRLFTLVFGSVDSANDDHAEMVRLAAAGDGEGLHALTCSHMTATEEAITRGYLAAHDASAG